MIQRQKRTIIWNSGGGTQSLAIAVLIKRGLLPRPERVVMADTTRESTRTWEFNDEIMRPLLASIGLSVEIITASKPMLYNVPDATLPLIPAFTEKGQIRNFCSHTWKRDTILPFLRKEGYGPKRPVLTWLGMSLEEIHRMKPTGRKWIENYYPLIQYLRTRRGECAQIVMDETGLEPPKSSCWCCPYQSNEKWLLTYKHYPSDWRGAMWTDYQIRERDKKKSLFLHRQAVPLDQVDLERPLMQFGLFDSCDEGYCFV